MTGKLVHSITCHSFTLIIWTKDTEPAKRAEAYSLGRKPQDRPTPKMIEPAKRATALGTIALPPVSRAQNIFTYIFPRAYALGFMLTPASRVKSSMASPLHQIRIGMTTYLYSKSPFSAGWSSAWELPSLNSKATFASPMTFRNS
jgi:hypothetical protein